MKRREFLKKTAATAAAVSAAVTLHAPVVHAEKSFQWKLVTTWPPHLPVIGEGAERFASSVEDLSEGRLRIQVYGGGELVPPLEAFDAVSQGVVEIGHGAAYYWAGKAPATQFFTSIPFGMNAQQMNAWLYAGDGLKLWEEVYAPFNLIPLPAGNTGVQMGGWFNKEINSIRDIKGLKMRIPGLGGKVIAKAGGSAILSAGGEIYTNLERGVIDATEWVGPYHDYLMGFHKAAKFYYYPGWHEPGSVLEIFINKPAFEKLPADLQNIIRASAAQVNIWMLSEFESKNNAYLRKLVKEEHVTLKRFPSDVLRAFRKYAGQVIDEVTAQDAMSRKVYTSFSSFQKDISRWAEVSEEAYYAGLKL